MVPQEVPGLRVTQDNKDHLALKVYLDHKAQLV